MSTKWQVPRYVGSRWDIPGAVNQRADLDWPRIGIYCDTSHDLWLIGSLTLSAEVLRQRNERSWGWRGEYLTGDGYLIPIGRRSPEGRTQNLADTEVWTQEGSTAARKRAAELAMSGRLDEADRVSAEEDRRLERLRSRFPMACKPCRMRRVFRSDSVQDIAEVFWSIGLREVDLATLARRVDRA